MKFFKPVLLALCAILTLSSELQAQTATASVKLTWTDTTNPSGTTYNVYRETSAGACSPGTTGAGPGCLLLNATPLTVLTYTDPSVAVGSTYYYVVRAINSSGFLSANSSEVTLNLATPEPPTGLSCTITISGSTVSGSCH